MKKIILMLAALTFMTGSAFACGQQPEKKEMTEQTTPTTEQDETTEPEKKECTNENTEQPETNTETAETETQAQ